MGGYGTIFAMIAKLKDNNSLIKKRNCFEQKQQYLKAARGKKIDIREATTDEMSIIKKMVIRERNLDFVKSLIALVITVAVTVFLLYYLIDYVF